MDEKLDNRSHILRRDSKSNSFATPEDLGFPIIDDLDKLNRTTLPLIRTSITNRASFGIPLEEERKSDKTIDSRDSQRSNLSRGQIPSTQNKNRFSYIPGTGGSSNAGQSLNQGQVIKKEWKINDKILKDLQLVRDQLKSSNQERALSRGSSVTRPAYEEYKDESTTSISKKKISLDGSPINLKKSIQEIVLESQLVPFDANVNSPKDRFETEYIEDVNTNMLQNLDKQFFKTNGSAQSDVSSNLKL